ARRLVWRDAEILFEGYERAQTGTGRGDSTPLGREDGREFGPPSGRSPGDRAERVVVQPVRPRAPRDSGIQRSRHRVGVRRSGDPSQYPDDGRTQLSESGAPRRTVVAVRTPADLETDRGRALGAD